MALQLALTASTTAMSERHCEEVGVVDVYAHTPITQARWHYPVHGGTAGAGRGASSPAIEPAIASAAQPRARGRTPQRMPGRTRRNPGQAGARLWPELEDDVHGGLGDLPEPAEADVAGQLAYRCGAGLGAER